MTYNYSLHKDPPNLPFLPQPTTKVLQLTCPSNVMENCTSLPVTEMEYNIVDAIQSHNMVILYVETGSGKSMAVPTLLTLMITLT